jgi:hypothetical protein
MPILAVGRLKIFANVRSAIAILLLNPPNAFLQSAQADFVRVGATSVVRY